MAGLIQMGLMKRLGKLLKTKRRTEKTLVSGRKGYEKENS
jgi:hypothetical protein